MDSRWIDRQIDRQTDGWIDRQIDGWIDRQIEKKERQARMG